MLEFERMVLHGLISGCRKNHWSDCLEIILTQHLRRRWRSPTNRYLEQLLRNQQPTASVKREMQLYLVLEDLKLQI